MKCLLLNRCKITPGSKNSIPKYAQMEGKSLLKQASQDEIILYCYMGEAVCMIQELESALSVSITIKKNSTATKEEADIALKKQRRYTLGKATNIAQKEMLLPFTLQTELNYFYKRRNWLIHQAMFENIEHRCSEIGRNQLFQKIKTIANDAPILQRAIEMDLISFCQSQGKDMSKILAAMEEHHKLQ